ncbi:MAG: hypothetical protein QOJ27_761 [Sphingomonadales bacterium]|nr:hypothetical protein [Sphingomonadales bacterium]
MAGRLPYPGLRSFKRQEADLFFGREDDADTMIARLMASRFLGVLGASGCGKSSLVRTALFEALDGGYSQAGSNWRIADCHPGGAPIHHLAEALAKASRKPGDEDTVAYIERELRRGPRSIALWCNEGNLADDEKLLILVDQFEELFTSSASNARDEADTFATLLVEASKADDAKIYIVVTMRSDYFGACGAHPALAAKIGEGIFLTPRMQRGQCAEAIVGPSEVLGFTIKDELLNRILNDMNRFAMFEGGTLSKAGQTGRQADQLPLMQYALNQMWLGKQPSAESDPGGGGGGDGGLELTLDDYRNIGGLEGALDKQGQTLIDRLAKNGVAEAEIEGVFRALVRGPTLELAVREARPLDKIAAVAALPQAQVERIVAEFADQRCLFLRDDGTDIDLSHESLIRRWSKLSGWFGAEAEAAETVAELARATRTWLDGGEADDDLLTGRPLERREAFWQARRNNPAWLERYRKPNDPDPADISRFLDRSVAMRNRRAVRMRALAGTAVALALTMSALVGWTTISAARFKARDAQSKKIIAETLALGEKKAAEAARIRASAFESLALSRRGQLENLNRMNAIQQAALQRDLIAARKLAALAQERERLAASAADSRIKAVKANALVLAELNRQIGGLFKDDVNALTTPRRALVAQFESIANIASNLPPENAEMKALGTGLAVGVAPYVIGAIGPKYPPADAAQQLRKLADRADGLSDPAAPVYAEFLRARAMELEGSEPGSLVTTYEGLLERIRGPAGSARALIPQVAYRLGVILASRGDYAGSARHLASCTDRAGDSVAQCRQLLALVASRAHDDQIVVPDDVIKDLKNVGERASGPPTNPDDLISTVLALNALRELDQRLPVTSSQLEDLRGSAALFDEASLGTEEAVETHALLEEALDGPGEKSFTVRRKILDRLGDYQPTLDFLFASEPTLKALVPEPDDGQSPNPQPSGALLTTIPSKRDLERSVERVARSSTLLRSYIALIDRTASLGAGGRPVDNSERAQAVERLKRMSAAEIASLNSVFARYAQFLERVLELKPGLWIEGLPDQEREQLSKFAATLYPVQRACNGLQDYVPGCSRLLDAIHAIDGMTQLEAFFDAASPSTNGGTDAPGRDAGTESYPQRIETELDGLAIDWLAVGQAWQGSTAHYCRDEDGKIYVRAFPNGPPGGPCGKSLVAAAVAEYERLTASGSRDSAWRIVFEQPVPGKMVRAQGVRGRFSAVSGNVGSPAPGRIGQMIIRVPSGIPTAFLWASTLDGLPASFRHPWIPPCQAPDVPPQIKIDPKNGRKRLGQTDVIVVTVVCHADGSYSQFEGLDFDSRITPGRWVSRGESLGTVAVPKGAAGGTLTWSVRSDGLYNWDESERNVSDLYGIAKER